MPLTQSFTTSQVLGESSNIVLTDTSTGTDVLVVSRRVYITDKNGLYYGEDGETSTTAIYTEWDNFPGTTTLTIEDVLTQDRSVNVRVDWIEEDGDVRYTATDLQDYTLYAKTLYINSIKAQSNNNQLKAHANFYINMIKLLISIKEADDSVTLLDDISSSQAALNRAKKLVDNPSYFY